MSARGAADDDVSGFDLDPLRERALAGQVSAEELLKKCLDYMRKRWERLASSGGCFRDSDEAYDNAQQKLADLITMHGPFLEGPPKLAGYLNAAITNRWRDEARKAGTRRGAGIPWPLDDPDSREVPDPNAEADYADAEGGYEWERVRAAASRRIPLAVTEQCPFHLAGCPQRELVLRELEKLINSPDEDFRDVLRTRGRELGYSSKDHEVQVSLVCCYEWWRYRIFSGTFLDAPGADSPDRLRWPIVSRLNVKESRWQSSRFCSPDGARLIMATDAKFGELLRAHKPEVCEYLEGGAS